MTMVDVEDRGLPLAMRHVSRRSVTSTFNPLSITGCVGWWDMSDITSLWKDAARTSAVSADGDIILGVTDKSGAGKHLSVAANGPTYKPGIQNSLSVARFDGTNDTLANAAISADASHTWIAVGVKRSAASGGTRNLMAFGAGTNAQLFANSAVDATKWCYFANGGGASVVIGGTVTSWTALVLKTNSAASLDAFANGGAAVNFDPNDEITTGTSVSLGSISTPAQFGDVDFGELLHYDTALSIASLNQIGVGMAAKWSFTWNTAS